MIKKYRRLVVRHPMKLLAEIIAVFDNPEVSFEGYGLRRYDLERFGSVEYDAPTPLFSKSIIAPPSDFLILRLNETGKKALCGWLSELEPYPNEIHHVRIVQDGKRFFQADDRFDEFGVYLLEEIASKLVPRLYQLHLVEEDELVSG